MSLHIERTLQTLIKNNAPDIQIVTLEGDYIIRFGDLELGRYEAGDRISATAYRAVCQQKVREGYQAVEYSD